MKLCLTSDTEGNSYIKMGTEEERFKGLVGANILTSNNQVPMNPHKGCQIENYIEMEDNVQEILQMLVVGDLFPSMSQNVPSIFLQEVGYRKKDNETGSIWVRFASVSFEEIQELEVPIRLG